MSTLPVSEVFGPTIQGEGPAAGTPASFIRLGGCNLSCSWCDTRYTWDGARYDLRKEIVPTDVDMIVRQLSTPLVVITGGEPLLHQQSDTFVDLLHALECYHTIHVETNGTIIPNGVARDIVDLWVVSPKLPNAGPHRGHQTAKLHPGWPGFAHAHEAHLKIVCQTAEDVAEAARLATEWDWPPGYRWVMPEGQTTAELAVTFPPVAAAAATTWDMRVTHRLHVLAWGSERGR
jgi:7-carboxy-7-deazaguanine synthase